jgi:hypothetical protein
MKPVNTKSLFSVLCNSIEKLESGEIDATQATAISKLVGQANNLLNYELKRAALMTNLDFKKNHRNLEIKSFDSLPEQTASHVVYAELEKQG